MTMMRQEPSSSWASLRMPPCHRANSQPNSPIQGPTKKTGRPAGSVRTWRFMRTASEPWPCTNNSQASLADSLDQSRQSPPMRNSWLEPPLMMISGITQRLQLGFYVFRRGITAKGDCATGAKGDCATEAKRQPGDLVEFAVLPVAFVSEHAVLSKQFAVVAGDDAYT